eukprot:1790948-Amphidinium_carterae.1
MASMISFRKSAQSICWILLSNQTALNYPTAPLSLFWVLWDELWMQSGCKCHKREHLCRCFGPCLLHLLHLAQP